MSFLLQRWHNECAVAVTTNLLKYYKIEVKYNEIKRCFNKKYNFRKVKEISIHYGLECVNYFTYVKNLNKYNFNAAILVLKKFKTNHFVLAIKKNNEVIIHDPGSFFPHKFNKRIQKRWTGFIMVVLNKI